VKRSHVPRQSAPHPFPAALFGLACHTHDNCVVCEFKRPRCFPGQRVMKPGRIQHHRTIVVQRQSARSGILKKLVAKTPLTVEGDHVFLDDLKLNKLSTRLTVRRSMEFPSVFQTLLNFSKSVTSNASKHSMNSKPKKK